MTAVMMGRAADPLMRGDAGIALVGACRDDYRRILRANHQLAELLGRPLEALVGARLCQHVHPDDQTQAHGAFLRLLADPETLYDSQCRLVAADGREVRVQALASVITMRTGPAIVLRVLALSPA
jgi:PAS domain S-box-containing protein